MARITVEDCVDKVANRFELVLLAAHRARSIAKGSAVSIDMREGLIHSLQHNVEIDEAETMAAPGVPRERHLSLGRDDQSVDTAVDTLSEEQLLRAMRNLTPVTESEEVAAGRRK